MVFTETRRLFQKILILGTLVACLGLLSAGVGKTASTDSNNNLLPCCSYCDEHKQAPICQHGCSLGCRTNQ
jgi:hypothetical protein